MLYYTDPICIQCELGNLATMLFASDGMPVPATSLTRLFEGTCFHNFHVDPQSYVLHVIHVLKINSIVLGIDPRYQADPREWFVTLVGEKCTEWQMFVAISMTQTSERNFQSYFINLPSYKIALDKPSMTLHVLQLNAIYAKHNLIQTSPPSSLMCQQTTVPCKRPQMRLWLET